MVGAPDEIQAVRPDAYDGRHDADVFAEPLEALALLDMQLEVGSQRAVRAGSIQHTGLAQSSALHALQELLAPAARILEDVWVQAACQRGAAQEADERALFVGEVDGLQMEIQMEAVIRDCSQDFEGGHDAQRSIETAAVRNRVEMRADQERRRVLGPAGQESRMIARAIRPERQAGCLDHLPEACACGEMSLAESGSVDAAIAGGTDGGELVKGREHAVGVDVKVCVHGLGSCVRNGRRGKSSKWPAKARDASMGTMIFYLERSQWISN